MSDMIKREEVDARQMDSTELHPEKSDSTRLAALLDRLEALLTASSNVARPPITAFRESSAPERLLLRQSRPPLPDPRLIRRIIRHRQMRQKFVESTLFADPAWDILLDLTAARAEHRRVSVTSLCIASGVPPTTALRWIMQMVREGLLERSDDDTDKRRAFISLSEKGADAMVRYFAAIGAGPDAPANASTAIS